MKKPILAGLASLLLCFNLHAQESGINLDDVVVTASHIPQLRDNVLADVTVIDKVEIERAGQSTLVELLQSQPGVEIASNGGAGKTTSIFLRGSNDDHIVVLVDGLRMSSATTGKPAFENIPLSQIERIEILRGPASGLYGADAIGGVIQIFTRNGQGEPHLSAFAGYGSYNTKLAEAGIAGSSGDTRYAVNVTSQFTDGFSATRAASGFDADRDPYHDIGLTANVTQHLAEGHDLSAQLFQSSGVSYYDCNKSICRIDQTLRSYGLNSRNRLQSWWDSTLRAGVSTDDSKSLAPGISIFRTEQRQYTWQNDFFLPLGTLTLAFDRLEQKVSGTTNYTINTRNSNGWVAGYVADYNAHTLQLNLRQDINSQYGDHATGGVAYGYHMTPAWLVTGSVGTAFKGPTFNQLYFPGFGNPNLAPESSLNREISLRYNTQKLRGGLTVFDSEIKNLIVNASASPFTPSNINSAKILGVTLDGAWSITENWTVRGNANFQSPEDGVTGKLLPRRAEQHGDINLLYHAGPFQAGTEVLASSLRYNDATNTKLMGGYTLVNLTASYALNSDFNLEARANNVLNRDYVLAYTGNTATSVAYNTPGANLFIGLRYNPK